VQSIIFVSPEHYLKQHLIWDGGEYTKKITVFCKNSDCQKKIYFHREHAKLLISASIITMMIHEHNGSQFILSWNSMNYPNTFVTGSRVAACENATSVNGVGSGLDAMSEVNVRRWTSRRACKESCHKSSTNLHQHVTQMILELNNYVVNLG
jgi:hypothetical protein